MLDWNQIDHVFLDLDGTLLDLAFDSFFWQQHVPARWAYQNEVSLDQAQQHMLHLTQQHKGQLAWYCLDFWSQCLGLDIVQLKHEVKHRVGLRENALEFLVWLKEKKALSPVLVTNAHPKTLEIKFEQVPLQHHFDLIVSAHNLEAPKEHTLFWENFRKQHDFDPARTLFVDDTASVLRAAKDYGVQYLLRVAQPDSLMDALDTCNQFRLLHDWLHLMDAE